MSGFLNKSSTIIILIAEILISSNTIAQTFSDSIFTKTDTIVGKITWVNDVNIFYDYKVRKQINNTYSPLVDVLNYKKDTITIDTIVKIKFEDKFINNYTDVDDLILGVKIIMSADYPLFHESIALSFTLRKHNFHVGPEFIVLTGDRQSDEPLYGWKFDNLGFNIGYRLLPKSNFKNLHYYFGFNYLVFEGHYVEYQLGPPFRTEHNELIFLNTGSIGVNYKLAGKFNIYSGIGLSSNKFFLMFEHPFINTTFGLEYLFVKKK